MQKKGCEVVLYSLAVDPTFKDFNHSSGLCRNLFSLEAVKSTRSDRRGDYTGWTPILVRTEVGRFWALTPIFVLTFLTKFCFSPDPN